MHCASHGGDGLQGPRGPTWGALSGTPQGSTGTGSTVSCSSCSLYLGHQLPGPSPNTSTPKSKSLLGTPSSSLGRAPPPALPAARVALMDGQHPDMAVPLTRIRTSIVKSGQMIHLFIQENSKKVHLKYCKLYILEQPLPNKFENWSEKTKKNRVPYFFKPRTNA